MSKEVMQMALDALTREYSRSQFATHEDACAAQIHDKSSAITALTTALALPDAQPATAPAPVRLTQADIDAAYFEALGSQHLRPQDKPSVSRFAYAIEKAIHAKASTQ